MGSPPIFKKPLASAAYMAGAQATALDGSVIYSGNGSLTYQWYWSADGTNYHPIGAGRSARYTPQTSQSGTRNYYVTATAHESGAAMTATSNIATIVVSAHEYTPDEAWRQYLQALKGDFTKLAKLEFLQPDGSVAFALDNNPGNRHSGAFIQDGTLTVNLQNGKRRTATVTLSNLDGAFDYNVNNVWFGQQVRLMEGLELPNGQQFYLPQGVFYVKDPEETLKPDARTMRYTLEDKWAYLDGTLFGNLEGIYEVPLGTNIFTAVQSVLSLDRGNGIPVDGVAPIFTDYYNEQTTTLPDGSTVNDIVTPYTYRCDSDNGCYADIVLEMNTMLAGWIGYDASGHLRLDPSQDDIVDATKPIQWAYKPTEKQFLGATYTIKNTDVYNDIVITGESLTEYGNTAGRASNLDPASDTNIYILGRKTLKENNAGFYSDKLCENLATFRLKRQTVLQKSVSIESTQIFHLQENQLVTIQRPDKPGYPVERHLVTGFTRPIAQTGPMTIEATSVNDFATATIVPKPGSEE